MALACDVVILAVPEKQGLHDVELGTPEPTKRLPPANSVRDDATRVRWIGKR